jgi:hypothetical protein
VHLFGLDALDDFGADTGRRFVVTPLHVTHDRSLGTHAGAFDDSRSFRLVHELGESTNISLVGFDRTTHFLEAFGLHGKADTAKHEPRGLLGHTQSPSDFVGADAVLGIGEKPNSGKPLIQSKRRVLKDRPHLDRELLTADAALPDTPSLEEHRVFGVTVGAGDTLRPAKELKELERDIGISEVGHRFAESLRGTNLRHDVIYNGGMGVSSILLP